MPASVTGDFGTLTLLSIKGIGDPVTHVRVRFSLDRTAATVAVDAFELWQGDGTTPVWAEAINIGLADGGDGGDPVTVYEVLLRLSDGYYSTWESFETYPLGTVGVMDDGGSIWDGAAVIGENYIRTVAWEDFESYAVGTVTTLDGGWGWDGAAIVEANE